MLTGAEVAAAVASVKNLRDLISSLKDSVDKHKLSAAVQDTQDKIIELQSVLIEAREALSAADERARTAEQKRMELEDWQHEAGRYALTEIAPGVLAYTPKPGMEAGEPPDKLCAACFEEHKKSILQFEPNLHFGDLLKCSRCPFSIRIGQGGYPRAATNRGL